jgi:hypothetical protein
MNRISVTTLSSDCCIKRDKQTSIRTEVQNSSLSSINPKKLSSNQEFYLNFRKKINIVSRYIKHQASLERSTSKKPRLKKIIKIYIKSSLPHIKNNPSLPRNPLRFSSSPTKKILSPLKPFSLQSGYLNLKKIPGRRPKTLDLMNDFKYNLIENNHFKH